MLEVTHPCISVSGVRGVKDGREDVMVVAWIASCMSRPRDVSNFGILMFESCILPRNIHSGVPPSFKNPLTASRHGYRDELYPCGSDFGLRLRLRSCRTTRLGTVELLRSKACIGVSNTRSIWLRKTMRTYSIDDSRLSAVTSYLPGVGGS
jgi:hypothetical protein